MSISESSPKSWAEILWKSTRKKAGLMDSLDINGIHTAAGTFEFPSSGVTLAWTGIGQNKDMINPCAMMVYMGGIANDGTAVLPTLIKPTTFLAKNRRLKFLNSAKKNKVYDRLFNSTVTD